MALLQYFKLKKQKEHLPDPNGPLSQKIPSSGISSANAGNVQCMGETCIASRDYYISCHTVVDEVVHTFMDG